MLDGLIINPTLGHTECSLYYWFCCDQSVIQIKIFVGRGGKKGAVEPCPTCRGTGMQVQIQQFGPGMIQQIQSMCQECRGQGERINPKDRCKTCQGRKVT